MSKTENFEEKHRLGWKIKGEREKGAERWLNYTLKNREIFLQINSGTGFKNPVLNMMT